MTQRLLMLPLLIVLSCSFFASFSHSSEPGQGEAVCPSRSDADVRSRTFKFIYGAVLTELRPGSSVRVWLPVAPSNHDQDVTLIHINVPGPYRRTTESGYGNRVIFFEATANEQGEVPIEVSYRICRRELTPREYEPADKVLRPFLSANQLVPTDDRIRDIVLSGELKAGSDLESARQIYDAVLQHMKYDKPEDQSGWGNGDANWACDHRFGNCTDFHSLFISVARNQRIPARFEIGFPIPPEIGSGEVGGYHCWAKFAANGKWVPVDISEADKNPKSADYYFGNLTTDRVLFSKGRDLELQPAPESGPVNFLVYPYAEVNGVQHKSFRKAFRYEDLADE